MDPLSNFVLDLGLALTPTLTPTLIINLLLPLFLFFTNAKKYHFTKLLVQHIDYHGAHMIHGSFPWIHGKTLMIIPMSHESWDPSMNHGTHESWKVPMNSHDSWELIWAFPWMGASHEPWKAPMNHGWFHFIEQQGNFPIRISGNESLAKYKKIGRC
jgi:hypothetical protein